MDAFKDFQGKTLDDAIHEACVYYDLPREKLEIEIVQDAKSGIFGLVGARKAMVRARRAALREALESALGGRDAAQSRPDRTEHPEHGDRAERRGHPEGAAHADHGDGRPDRQERQGRRGRAEKPEASERPDRRERRDAPDQAGRRPRQDRAERSERTERPERPERQDGQERAERPERRRDRAPGGGRPERRKPVEAAAAAEPEAVAVETAENDAVEAVADPAAQPAAPASVPPAPQDAPAPEDAPPLEDMDEDDADLADDGAPRMRMADLDPVLLVEAAREAVRRLAGPIAGDGLVVEAEIAGGCVRVSVDGMEDSGLLIGREGQTLAAIQYLAARIVSRAMGAAVRLQLDAGRYRQRQDEKIREMALALAERVRQSGRSHSTRPLSSYHRRIVHMAMQDQPDLQTRSSGDGPLKRVVILRKRAEQD